MTKPDPVHDETAYAELTESVYQANKRWREVEDARRVELQRIRQAEQDEQERQQREELNGRYPSSVPSDVYELARRLAYDHHDDFVDTLRLFEEYKDIVAMVNTAIEENQMTKGHPNER